MTRAVVGAPGASLPFRWPTVSPFYGETHGRGSPSQGRGLGYEASNYTKRARRQARPFPSVPFAPFPFRGKVADSYRPDRGQACARHGTDRACSAAGVPRTTAQVGPSGPRLREDDHAFRGLLG